MLREPPPVTMPVMGDYPETMRAMVLERPGEPLALRELPVPAPGPHDVLIRVAACGVCRTDLHIVDGELTEPKLPLVPGHEIVGEVVATGEAAGPAVKRAAGEDARARSAATATGKAPGENAPARSAAFSPGAPPTGNFAVGDRVGVPWLGGSCGECCYCRRGQENLCDAAVYTGYTRDGGYAEYTLADARYCLPLPDGYDDVAAAPLLCAGLIGYRTYRMAGSGIERLGIYGFGAAAHIVAQVAVQQGVSVYAFTRPGDGEGQDFARRLGCAWAGGSDEAPPERLDAALIFAPVGALVPEALAAVDKGGSVVCGGIHMSDIPSFPYRLLWEERILRSVANLTRADGGALMDAAGKTKIETETHAYPLEKANEALDDLRAGRFTGAAVLQPA